MMASGAETLAALAGPRACVAYDLMRALDDREAERLMDEFRDDFARWMRDDIKPILAPKGVWSGG